LSLAIHASLGIPRPLYRPVDAFLESRGWSWEGLRSGETPASPHQVVMRLWHDDPVLFIESTLINRDDGSLWRLYPYQADALRYPGHTVARCAAEVGKTRGIVAAQIHSAYFRRGDQLIGASTDGALEDIWDELMFQLSSSPLLRAAWDKDGSKVKPYRKCKWKNGNIIHLRPAAHDGRAFRGVHVRRRADMDEAALIDNRQTWAEFFRACKEGCIIGLWSVPVAMATEYSRIASRAPFFEAERAASFNHRRFVLVHWSRPMMPTWTAARDAEMVELFGGRDTPGYRRNVLGEDAEPEHTVFPRERWHRVICHVPEWRRLDIVRDQATNRIRLTAWRLNHNWRLEVPEDAELDVDTAANLLEEGEDSRRVEDLDPEVDQSGAYESALGLLRPFVRPLSGRLVLGADLGRATDPTEVLVSEVAGVWRWLLRVHMRRIDWRHQAVLLAALDELLGYPIYGLGIDATVQGAAVESVLRSLALDGGRHRYRDRLSGFLMGERVPEVVLETGERLQERRGDRTISRKELGTRILEGQLQTESMEVPWDPDYLADFPRHTASHLKSGERRYSDVNDHTVDSARCAVLRWYEVEHGDAAPSGPLRHGTARTEDRRDLRRARRASREMERAFRR